jgi:hypothetical protein
MDEVELKNIQLSFPSTRSLARGDGFALEERVETNYGSVLVAIQGDRLKPAIVTYHDLGLNCKFCQKTLKRIRVFFFVD